MTLTPSERRDLMDRTRAFPEQADLSCAICGEHDLRGRFPHPDRTGAMICGECWSERERDQSLAQKVRHILAQARIYKTDPTETIKLIQRAMR